MENLKAWIIAHKVTAILIAGFIILAIIGLSFIQKSSKSQDLVKEVDILFDAEGPYAILSPRRDGNALILNLKRTASYDSISYELAYTSKTEEVAIEGNKVKSISGDGEGMAGGAIDRGVSGTIDTKDKKGEYEQEILFGTCSKNVCKYDKGVQNGTLVLHIRKGEKAYKMNTQWHLQKPDVALGILTSGDDHLSYKVDATREELSNIGYSIINDLTATPKLPSGMSVLGKAYALNIPIAKDLKSGSVILELAEVTEGAKLYRYNNNKSEWEKLDAKLDGSKFSAKVDGAGIFAVLMSNN